MKAFTSPACQAGFSLLELLLAVGLATVMTVFWIQAPKMKAQKQGVALSELLSMAYTAVQANDFQGLQQQLNRESNRPDAQWAVAKRTNGDWEISLNLTDKPYACAALARQLLNKSDLALPDATEINGQLLVKDSEETLCEARNVEFVWTNGALAGRAPALPSAEVGKEQGPDIYSQGAASPKAGY